MLADQLEHKLQLKRLGSGELKAESELLLNGVNEKIATLDENKKEDKKKLTALKKDKTALEARLARTDALLAAIGGQLTEFEARTLILSKLSDIARRELNRYLDGEKRHLTQAVTVLWDKYAVSRRTLESDYRLTRENLTRQLEALGYVA